MSFEVVVLLISLMFNWLCLFRARACLFLFVVGFLRCFCLFVCVFVCFCVCVFFVWVFLGGFGLFFCLFVF